jgi:hypothetical protein
MSDEINVTISKPRTGLSNEVFGKLKHGLRECPDVAFAYLPQVEVPEASGEANLVLFVWLKAEAMGSLRSALDLVSQVASGALPTGEFVDVAILNSVPELLVAIDDADCLIIDNEPAERQRVLSDARDPQRVPEALPPRKKWWWPF